MYSQTKIISQTKGYTVLQKGFYKGYTYFQKVPQRTHFFKRSDRGHTDFQKVPQRVHIFLKKSHRGHTFFQKVPNRAHYFLKGPTEGTHISKRSHRGHIFVKKVQGGHTFFKNGFAKGFIMVSRIHVPWASYGGQSSQGTLGSTANHNHDQYGRKLLSLGLR